MTVRPAGPLAAALFGLCVAVAAAAGEPELKGAFTQGGLVIGKTEPGAIVTVEGERLRVSPEGLFLVGFARDAAARLRLEVAFADGRRWMRTLEVAARKYPVERLDGLPERQVTPGPEELRRIDSENALIAAARAEDTARAWFASGFVWPLAGRISGVWGSQRVLNGQPRRPHFGVDVAAPAGAPVAAAADGTVAVAHPDMFFTGKTVLIDHGHGLTTVYAHLDEILVAAGEAVAKGRSIGRVGASGRVLGAHLHWGANLFAVPLDPALLVGPMPGAP